MKLVFAQLAVEDLVRLHLFIAEHNPQSTTRAANRIKSSAKLLSDQPLIGRPARVPTGEERNDIRDFLLTLGPGGYILRYQLLKRQIRVLRIWHTREDRS